MEGGGLLALASQSPLIVEITTAAEFERITTLSEDPDALVVIDFQKSHCKPCIRTAPEYLALAEKFKNKAAFYKIDADTGKESLAILKANGIRSVPTFHVWRRGKKIDSVQGAHVDEVETIVQTEINIIESRGVRQPNEI